MLPRNLAPRQSDASLEVPRDRPRLLLCHNLLPLRVHSDSLQCLLRLHWSQPLPRRPHSHGLGLRQLGVDKHDYCGEEWAARDRTHLGDELPVDLPRADYPYRCDGTYVQARLE